MNDMNFITVIALYGAVAIPVFLRVVKILWTITKGEYDFRTKGRFNKHNHFWDYSSYILILPWSAVLNIMFLLQGKKNFDFLMVVAICIVIELFFWASYRMLNEYRSWQARRLRAKWCEATSPPIGDVFCPPNPDAPPRQECHRNDKQINFDLVYTSDGLLIAWNLRESQFIQADLKKAESYLNTRKWFRKTVGSYYGTGIGGVFSVFLFRVKIDSHDDDEFLWVVTGDIPTTHIFCENTPSPQQALREYLSAMPGVWKNKTESSETILQRLQLLSDFLKTSKLYEVGVQ